MRVEIVYWYEPSVSTYLFPRARMARLWGSDAMRLQIKKSMTPHLPNNIDLTFSGLPLGRKSSKRVLAFQAWLRTRRPAVFILLKNVVNRISPAELAQLSEKAIAVGVDHLDAEPSRIDLMQYDFHISASETGRRALETMIAEDCTDVGRRPAVEVFYQSYDCRLENMRAKQSKRFSALYLGAPANAAIPASLSNDIRCIQVERNEEMEQMTETLVDYNFHYAVRPSPEPILRRAYKPFTKGVTAAVCQSNILVNQEVDDATEFLTTDYPYLIKGNGPEEVENTFRKAEEEFGGPEWKYGLEIMRSVRARVSGPAQAQQFAGIVTRAAERK